MRERLSFPLGQRSRAGHDPVMERSQRAPAVMRQWLSRSYRRTARVTASAREIPGVRVCSASMSRSTWAALPRQIWAESRFRPACSPTPAGCSPHHEPYGRDKHEHGHGVHIRQYPRDESGCHHRAHTRPTIYVDQPKRGRVCQSDWKYWATRRKAQQHEFGTPPTKQKRRQVRLRWSEYQARATQPQLVGVYRGTSTSGSCHRRSGQAAFGRHQEPRPGFSVEADRRHARSSDARLLRRGSRAGVDNGRTGTAAAEGRRGDLADARLNPVGWCAAGVLTAADSLYLFCTWTSAFERFSRIWHFGFPKVLGNMDFWADRLPPPSPL